MNTRDRYAIGLLTDEVSTTSTTVGVAVDLANYFDPGRREIKFLIATNWGSTVAATAETATIYVAESDSTSSAGSTSTDYTAISGVTVTTAAGGESVTEVHGMVTKRYIHARAVTSTTATAIFGVAVIALPHRRFAA